MKAFIIFLLFLSAGYFSQALGATGDNSTDECPYINQKDRNGEWSRLLASLNMEEDTSTRETGKGKGNSKSSGQE